MPQSLTLLETDVTARDLASGDDPVSALGRCRAHVLSAAAMVLALSECRDPIERDGAREEFAYSVAKCRETLDRVIPPAVLRRLGERAPDALGRFSRYLDALPDPHAPIARAEAMSLYWDARRHVLPAVMALIEVILVEEAERRRGVLEGMQTRTRDLEAMFREMEKIGRTIRLISLNAAVEAARAGGESGRAFGVIAGEVRTLATRANELLGRARRGLDG